MNRRAQPRAGGAGRHRWPRRSPFGFQQNYREIVELAPIGIFLSTIEGRFLGANAAFARMLGYESVEDLLRLEIPKDVYFDERGRDRIVARSEQVHGIVSTEALLKRKDGSPVPVRFDGRVVRNRRGRVIGFEGFVHDITESKRAAEALARSEERFRAVVENSHEVIGLLGADERWIYASPSVLRILGYSPQEVLETRDFGERLHPDDVDWVREQFVRLMGDSGSSATFQFRGRHRDGSWRVLEAAAVNRLDEPTIRAVVVNLRDITAQAQADERLRRSYEEIRALAARMETVREEEASRIAHELHDEIGQALTAVKLQLQTLQRRAETPGLADELSEGIASTERALEQVRDLSLSLRPSVLDDLGLTAALRWYLDRQAQLSGFAAELHADAIPARLPRELETACFRVVQQALTNVARHARARHVSVELRRGREDLRLSIRDDGVGFDSTAAQARARAGQSLGILGMKERVSLLGGQFTLRSDPSSGTEIQVRFPAVPDGGTPGER
ncbi:MAG TPA: PAS domain S-box protein [Thermoanaerobaculia bacterium]|nr:PAS domain S-box protein [Thermoanaerobaculia bacterium]